jgi:Na+-translocating ferredoxin:NAD+ oxidoreductase subunit G
VKNNQKKHSSLLKDALILCIITLIAGLSLAYTNEVTKGPIAAKQLEKKQEAYSKVYTDAKKIIPDNELTQAAATADLSLMDSSYRKVKVNEISKAADVNGNTIGYIIAITTKGGYNPPISMVIGYSNEKEITGFEYLSFNESKSVDVLKNEYRTQYIGKTGEYFSFDKDAGTKVDAISGATISSNGIIDAVNAGIGYLNEYVIGGAGQ